MGAIKAGLGRIHRFILPWLGADWGEYIGLSYHGWVFVGGSRTSISFNKCGFTASEIPKSSRRGETTTFCCDVRHNKKSSFRVRA
jgi:hypothetical protein